MSQIIEHGLGAQMKKKKESGNGQMIQSGTMKHGPHLEINQTIPTETKTVL